MPHLVFNLAHGPLFDLLYEDICRDQGSAAVGTPDHRAAVLSSLQTPSILGRKHDKVALRRWFSWVAAASSNLQSWHAKLLVITYVGIRQGVYKHVAQCPLWQGPSADLPALDGDSDAEAA